MHGQARATNTQRPDLAAIMPPSMCVAMHLCAIAEPWSRRNPRTTTEAYTAGWEVAWKVTPRIDERTAMDGLLPRANTAPAKPKTPYAHNPLKPAIMQANLAHTMMTTGTPERLLVGLASLGPPNPH